MVGTDRRTVRNAPPTIRRARGSRPINRQAAFPARSDSAFLEFCWQRPLHKRLISKSLSGGKDQSACMISTFRTSRSMTEQWHSHSGQSIWRTASGVPLIWMRIGMPLWNAGLYPSFFAFPMRPSLHRAQSSSAQTQTARTARLSRKAASMSFTGRSSK